MLDLMAVTMVVVLWIIICVLLLSCCCYRGCVGHNRVGCDGGDESDDVVPTATDENFTYQMAPLPPSCPGAAYPVRTRAAVPSRATVETGYQLEPKAGPPPDVGRNSNDKPPSYADLYPEY